MERLTLLEYAKSTDQTVMSAFELAREADALSTEQGNIYVNIEVINGYLNKGGMNIKGESEVYHEHSKFTGK